MASPLDVPLKTAADVAVVVLHIPAVLGQTKGEAVAVIEESTWSTDNPQTSDGGPGPLC